MSDSSQGPGWWVASDGKWYAPEQHPDYVAPSSASPPDPTPDVAQPPPIAPTSPLPPASSQLPPTSSQLPPAPAPIGYAPAPVGYGGAGPGKKKTNGMAVASLVLGIVWLGGIGSVLAVIFGFMSRKKIEESQGQEQGGGFAIAGLVLGFVGILGAIGFWLLVVVIGTAVNATGSYANGYDYGSNHYSSSSSESSVCSSINVPSGNISSSWIAGCRDAWSVHGGFSGNTGTNPTPLQGNSGSGATTPTTSGNSGNTGTNPTPLQGNSPSGTTPPTTAGNSGNTGTNPTPLQGNT